MSLENVIIGTIAAIFGCIATIITAVIANKRKEKPINDKALESSIKTIVDELNIENAYFYILNDSSKKSIGQAKVEFQTKYKYESKSAGGGSYQIYQITGRSGRIGVFIAGKDCKGLSARLLGLGKHF
jgi:hypothetical protein